MHLVSHTMSFTEQEIMLVVLGLIDVVMISNLLIMVIVGGYETFVSRMELQKHPDQPEWLSHVNASVLKIKLAMAIIGISSIHLLRVFIYAGSARQGDLAIHGRGREVAGHHPRHLHSVGDRHRLRGEDQPGYLCGRQEVALATQSCVRWPEFCSRPASPFSRPSAVADAAFDRFVQSLWPEAQKLGVSRATFDAATRGLEPDLSLPDLVIPGRPDRQPAQAEFVQTPAEYLKESAFDRLAAQGRTLAEKHRATLAQDRAALRRAGRDRAGDLGARDELRRGEDAAQRGPRAGDAGVSRAAARSSSARNFCSR